MSVASFSTRIDSSPDSRFARSATTPSGSLPAPIRFSGPSSLSSASIAKAESMSSLIAAGRARGHRGPSRVRRVSIPPMPGIVRSRNTTEGRYPPSTSAMASPPLEASFHSAPLSLMAPRSYMRATIESSTISTLASMGWNHRRGIARPATFQVARPGILCRGSGRGIVPFHGKRSGRNPVRSAGPELAIPPRYSLQCGRIPCGLSHRQSARGLPLLAGSVLFPQYMKKRLFTLLLIAPMLRSPLPRPRRTA